VVQGGADGEPDARRGVPRRGAGEEMTNDEAREESFNLLANTLRLDEFQRIAAKDLLRDLDGFKWPPGPDSEHEKKLMSLGAIFSERLPR
jgi:hypothetical protein